MTGPFRSCDRCRNSTDTGAVVRFLDSCALAGRVWLCARCAVAHAGRCPVCRPRPVVKAAA